MLHLLMMKVYSYSWYLQIYVKNVSVPMVLTQIHKIVWTPVYYSADAVSATYRYTKF